MIIWLLIVAVTLRSLLRNQRELARENLALRNQLAVLKHRHSRPRLSDVNRLFWALLSSELSARYAEHALDHRVILGERHLERVPSCYAEYYHKARTHLSLGMDTPLGRPIQSPEQGKIVELKRVRGLHHEYVRMAA